MTAQVTEIITIDGQRHRLCALPLTPLFRSWHPERIPPGWAALFDYRYPARI